MTPMEEAVIELNGDPEEARQGLLLPNMHGQIVLVRTPNKTLWWSNIHRGLVRDCGYIGTYEEFIEARDRLANKPDWSEAPDWANWLAQDINGDWWWYSRRPEAKTRVFADISGGLSTRCSSEGYVFGDWQATLELRPKSADPGRPHLAGVWVSSDKERIAQKVSAALRETIRVHGVIIPEVVDPATRRIVDQLYDDIGPQEKTEDPWNGEGIPPAGTVCEVKHNGLDDWVKVEVLTGLIHTDHPESPFVGLRTMDGPVYSEDSDIKEQGACWFLYNALPPHTEFRPVTDDHHPGREKVVLKAVEETKVKRKFAEALYDANMLRYPD